MPIKSNASFELYQSQFVLENGLVNQVSYPLHPYHSRTVEGRRYREIGERAYLAEKKTQAWDSISKEPIVFCEKVASRFIAATLWLHSDVRIFREHPHFIWFQLIGMLPFIGLLGIILLADHQRDPWIKPAICCYAFYLLPYILVSYYERYGVAVTLPRILFTFWLLRELKEKFFSRVLAGKSEAAT